MAKCLLSKEMRLGKISWEGPWPSSEGIRALSYGLGTIRDFSPREAHHQFVVCSPLSVSTDGSLLSPAQCQNGPILFIQKHHGQLYSEHRGHGSLLCYWFWYNIAEIIPNLCYYHLASFHFKSYVHNMQEKSHSRLCLGRFSHFINCASSSFKPLQ